MCKMCLHNYAFDMTDIPEHSHTRGRTGGCDHTGSCPGGLESALAMLFSDGGQSLDYCKGTRRGHDVDVGRRKVEENLRQLVVACTVSLAV